ncbi:MAG: ASKHA domain-containing protein [Eubacteriales bacterium]|nr:ASKHA domain-containing protein [Eubacteriales bacterium]
MSHIVKVHTENGENAIKTMLAEDGDNLLEVLLLNSVLIDSECGGNGTCGKCTVGIMKKGILEYKLACEQNISGNLEVYLCESSQKAKIVVEGRETPDAHKQNEGSKGNFNLSNIGFAVDIGTTTIVAYLYDLNKGQRIDVRAELNPQRVYGADVISRIAYTNQSKENSDRMHEVLINALDRMFSSLVSKNGLDNVKVSKVLFAGNTTMLHFLMELPAASLAVTPFTPVTVDLVRMKSSKLGLKAFPEAEAIILPGVSAYIGADTVAAVLSSRMYESKKICLLLDMGTNGEIVLGNSEWMLSCSAAAGPAFEGANIECGSGSVEGAIDAVVLFENEITYSAIGDMKATTICGSGLVDAAAVMLRLGVLDTTGRIIDKNEVHEDKIRKRLIEIDGSRAFTISYPENAAESGTIYLTQKDIRELQKAKGAIYAGILILIERAGIRPGDIEKVYLAGGFGSMMNPRSAVDIGLLPSELESKVEALGNAAGQGAIECLLNEGALNMVNKISRKISNIELSNTPEFIELYIESMGF